MEESESAPKWLLEYDWAHFNHNLLTDAETQRLEDAFAVFFRSKTKRELYEEALKRRILLAPCNDPKDILEQPQLRDRGLFVTLTYPHLGASIEHPAFFARSSLHRLGLSRRAPRVGEHNSEILGELGAKARSPSPLPKAGEDQGEGGRLKEAGKGLFAGMKILELASGAAIPVVARYFAEQGARVIRVESSTHPDFLRVLFLTPDNPHGMNGSPMFVLLNPNKESVSINLKKSDGIALVKQLVGWADVVTENFSPGVMQKWGLDYPSLATTKPELIMLSGCLFGQTGPQRSYPGFGGQSSAIAGFNHLTGWPDRESVGPYGTITDSLAPRYAALVLLAAVLERRRTARGQHLDVAQVETGVYSLSEAVVRCSANGEVVTRQGNADENACPHGVYPCAGTEQWIAIAVWSDEEWRALVRVMGSPAWAIDPALASLEGRLARREALEAELSRWTSGSSATELMEKLQSAGLEAARVQGYRELLEDRQLAHRGHFRKIRHARLGEMQFEHSGIVLPESPRTLDRPAPDLGEHTERVLPELLGLGPEEIARLKSQDVLI
jgi:crotonobetainyl-CoA:carnitine CoA-transferase CaiB-like acyl-CoA transferase